MPKMLADAKDTLWVLDEWPSDPPEPEEINAGENVSCSVAKQNFNIGPTTPTTTADTPLCEQGEMQIPTSPQYSATFDIYRFFNPVTGQLDVEGDQLAQRFKEFGASVVVAYRAGGKDHTQPAAEGDEISVYELISGQLGGATDRAGWSKRPVQASVARAMQDVWVGGSAPTTAP